MAGNHQTPKDKSHKKKQATRKETEKKRAAAVAAASSITPTPSKKRKSPPVSNPRTTALERFQNSVYSDSLVQIKPDRILNWIRQCFQSSDKSDRASAPNTKRRAINGFNSMSYTPSVKADDGKSLRLATIAAKKNRKKESSGRSSTPVGLSNSDSPVAALESIPSTNTVESLRMRRYLLEDIIATPVGESVVICVEGSHSNFGSYSEIYKRTKTPLPIFYLGRREFIQMHATVSKQSRTDALTKEPFGINGELFQHLLVGNGNGAIGLCFGVDDLEIPWKELFFECETIHIWGSSPPRRQFYKSLKSVTAGRPSLFNRLATELEGDTAQVIDLCSAYATIESLESNQESAVASINADNDLAASADALGLEGPEFKSFHKGVEEYVHNRIEATFGCFISLTDGILEEERLNQFVDLMYSTLPNQCNALMSLLGYNYNCKTRTIYLDPVRR
jgi:hypothetical protein|mmetsp:Transcript_16536/g.29854  ORF Transcript_16536/g.29854 Transcript_16536/m.29854 type:complete len:450 (-) Transcript_16536:1094-2443(-)